MESKEGVENKGNTGHNVEYGIAKLIDSKLDEVRALKDLLEKSDKLQELYGPALKLEGGVSLMGNHRFKTARLFNPKCPEVMELEKLEKLLVDFKTDYEELSGSISKSLVEYNNRNKKAFEVFKVKNEQLINKIDLLTLE
ncbi:hypothetical protein [Methanobacterium sp.]|uniref:hypothetical protein n=1 Tax=Methanobacterium sp. TaxID=2164 RepID=UPI003C7594CA